MTRFNTFNQIHKALRSLLFDTSLSIQHTNFANPEEVEPVLERILTVLEAFDQHASHEDSEILPVIREYEPSIVDLFQQEHILDHQLGASVKKIIGSYADAQTPDEQLSVGHQILHAFMSFTAFNLDHMTKEETVLNERLWRYYSDAEIQVINQRIVASLLPEEMRFTATWMMKGMNNAEITSWLRMVQASAPEAVFNMLFSIAEKELTYQRFRAILEDLTEGAMVA